ncbi:nucleotidyltransferase family protein [Spirosoma radiotolerans]|uniref:Nucleotidyltransferase family protein n=1 Tax=Spirosoma radiotolerans TaxID=1379870 RepID=A0A0E3ZUP5_9BACT|nr:nucleotidyltransferase family protein [Spirosoma radiotolerans]AKD54565.1 hypothetical protein SD10_06220 [Spirosoma radiotolerans]
MKVDLSPEVTFLLMACSVELPAEKRDKITRFVSHQAVNWNRLYALAERHRLKPFLYHSLRQIGTVPDSFLAALKQDCQVTTTDNLLKLHQYHSVAMLLADNGIDHIPLKGIYLAEHVYPDSGLRISGDIDLLVRPTDVFATIDLLQKHQYHLSEKQDLQWRQGEERILSDLFEVSLFKPFFNDSQFDIDMHWQIMGFNQHYALFDLAYVQAQPAFEAERKIVLLATHHGVNNIWQQIYYINDLYFTLIKADVNWSWLLQELSRYGFTEVFLAGLYWCQQIWDLPLPPPVQELVASPSIRSLAETYAKHWETETPSEFSYLIVKQLTLLLKAQTSVGDQLKTCATFLSSRVFRYSIFRIGKRLIYVPKELGFITIFIRAIQSLFRFLPGRR